MSSKRWEVLEASISVWKCTQVIKQYPVLSKHRKPRVGTPSVLRSENQSLWIPQKTVGKGVGSCKIKSAWFPQKHRSARCLGFAFKTVQTQTPLNIPVRWHAMKPHTKLFQSTRVLLYVLPQMKKEGRIPWRTSRWHEDTPPSLVRQIREHAGEDEKVSSVISHLSCLPLLF